MRYAEILNAFDRWRQRQLWLPAWLDNTDAKTWLWHAAIAVGVGHAIALLPGIDAAEGMRVMVGVYFVREMLNRTSWQPLRFDYRYKPLDGVMDVAAPLITTELLVRF